MLFVGENVQAKHIVMLICVQFRKGGLGLVLEAGRGDGRVSSGLKGCDKGECRSWTTVVNTQVLSLLP